MRQLLATNDWMYRPAVDSKWISEELEPNVLFAQYAPKKDEYNVDQNHLINNLHSFYSYLNW